MVAGINGASNSPQNKKKTKNYDPKTGKLTTAWMPFQGQKKEKKKEGIVPKINKRNLQLYRTYVETGDWSRKKFKDKTGIDY